tara:strand:- start:2689 stop:4416 length:1728 start_codon:yes stop_codon:yes gene_type:complete
MKIKESFILFFLAISWNNLHSQEFDPNFLASLPEDVRQDLINQSQERQESFSEQFKRPSSFIQKPQNASQRFGMNIFSMMQTTLMPINEPNFDANYVLDFGDVIELQLIGQLTSNISLPIKRDGSVNIPEIGKVIIAGMSLEEATKLIKSKIDAAYIGVESFVTLTEIRNIQIIVSGNVFNPGLYTLNGNSNMFHALSVSGGPSEDGSFRNINLIRGDKIIETLDLYDIFIFGKSSFGKKLKSGDVIFVNPSLGINGIFGGIKRSGYYEIKEDESLEDLIYFANGFSPDSDKNVIFKEEIIDGKVSNTKIEYKNLRYEQLSDGENIFVRQYPIKKVTISGAVKNPGTYGINDGDGILELVSRAGGYSNNAYEFGGILENSAALSANLFARDQLYRSLLSSIIDNTQMQPSAMESLGIILSEIKNAEVTGRVVTEFSIDKLEQNPSKNTILHDGDTLFIPEKITHLYIFGQVSNQGSSNYVEGKDVDFYINQQGGLLESADLNNIFVIHPNGTSQAIKKPRNVFAGKSSKIALYPGSIIFIPKEYDNVFLSQSVQAYSSILGNIGVTLASLSVLKD